MLRKMLFQGLFAAAVIAGSAAVYAVATAAEPPPAMPAQTAAGRPTAEAGVGTGYLQPGQGRPAESRRDRRESRERHEMHDRERHERHGGRGDSLRERDDD